MNTDTLIIGSGVAGAAIASKLLQSDPHASILMLEAGSKVEMRDFAKYQNYMVNGQTPYSFCQDKNYPDRDKPGENATNNSELQLRGSRLMMYGGSTVHWGGWSFRLKPEDFKLNTLTGNGIDWPFPYDELEPYYGQAEHYIGVAGDSDSSVVPRTMPYPYPAYPYTLEDEPLREALEESGYEYNHMPIARHGITNTDSPHAPCQTTGTCKYCPFGARFVAANYLDDMKRFNDYPNFIIKRRAFVKEILMDSKSRVKGVVYTDLDTKEEFTVQAAQTIVAAGAIESAKLLLRSLSSYWENGIGNDRDLVGRNLITHPYFIYQAELEDNPRKLQPEMNFPTMVSRHFDSTAEQAKGKFILVSPPGAPDPVDPHGQSSSIVKLMQAGYTRNEIDRIVKGKAVVQIHGIMEVFSHPDNRIRNFNKLNHLGMIETSVSYTQPADFAERVQEIEAHLKGLFDKMGAKNMTRVMMSWRADHAACLTRMSKTPEDGVVDSNMKVFGIDNLYVCSNASFSSLGAVNPTLTLTALSLRLGDHLVKNMQSSDQIAEYS
ncbi:MAG: GMC family oxidoreductase, partial [Cyclobacteriaceae bacterium]